MSNTMYDNARKNAPIIKAMLNDGEFMAGGIFTKEEFYMKKYGLTSEEIANMQSYLWWALNPDTTLIERQRLGQPYKIHKKS